MLTDAELAQCQQVAEAAMTDSVWITGPSTRATNPATGQVEDVPGPDKYGTAADPGRGLVQAVGSGFQAEQIIGGQVVTVGTYAVKIPITVGDLQPNDEVHVVASADPALVGQTLIVSEPTAGNTFGIQRRLIATLDLG